MIPANKPLIEKAKARWDLFECCPHAKDDTCSCCDKCLKEKWILLNDVLDRIKLIKEKIVERMYGYYRTADKFGGDGRVPPKFVLDEIDSFFSEDTQTGRGDAPSSGQKQQGRLGDLTDGEGKLEQTAASPPKSSPSQNSQKCKGCNQDFEGVHRSYCPTQKDRTRKVRR